MFHSFFFFFEVSLVFQFVAVTRCSSRLFSPTDKSFLYAKLQLSAGSHAIPLDAFVRLWVWLEPILFLIRRADVLWLNRVSCLVLLTLYNVSLRPNHMAWSRVFSVLIQLLLLFRNLFWGLLFFGFLTAFPITTQFRMSRTPEKLSTF